MTKSNNKQYINMENKKQTAVEYMEAEIYKYLDYSIEGNHKAEPFTITDLLKAVEQAKKMDKQQRAELIVKMKSPQKIILYFNRLIAKSIRNSKK